METDAIKYFRNVVTGLGFKDFDISCEMSGSCDQLREIYCSGEWRSENFPLSCDTLSGLAREYKFSIGRESSRLPISNISEDQVSKMLTAVADGYHNETFSAIVWPHVDWSLMCSKKFFKDNKIMLFKDHKGHLKVALSVAVDPDCYSYQSDVIEKLKDQAESVGGKLKIANYLG